jgi:hypothetical protein
LAGEIRRGNPKKRVHNIPEIEFPVIGVYQNIQSLCWLEKTYDEILIKL